MAQIAGEVFNGVRALLNDQDNAVYFNTVQLEYFKIAYEALKQEMQDSNIPISNITSPAISIPQGITDIGGPTGPPLPKDLIEVLECWEVPANTNDDYMLMRRLNFLPKTSVLTSYLEVYSWQDQYINLLGAKGNIQVKIDYIAANLGDLVNENSQLRLTNCINYLKFATAALCSEFIGENADRATALSALATGSLDILMSIKIKNSQGIQTRRRPFMAGYKQRGSLYGR